MLKIAEEIRELEVESFCHLLDVFESDVLFSSLDHADVRPNVEVKSRGKKKPARKEWPLNKSLATRRNGQLMLLLAMVPEFQEDIATLRAHFGIPRSGYCYEDTEGLPEDRAKKMREKTRAAVNKKAGTIGGYFMPPRTEAELASREMDPESLRGWVYKIGEKFSLPYNLYNSAFWGVAHYALWNQILIPPRNWELLNDPRIADRALKVRWIAIRAYAPLDEVESAEALVALNDALRQNIPKGLAKKRRVRRTDETKLADVARVIEGRQAGIRSFDATSRKRLARANALARGLFGHSLKSRRSKKKMRP